MSGDPQENVVEAMTENPPAGMVDWLGHAWSPSNGPAAQPNSRYTVPLGRRLQFPSTGRSGWSANLSIYFCGRRARLAPLVYEATSCSMAFTSLQRWHRRLLPQRPAQLAYATRSHGHASLLRYNMADYFRHWLDMGSRIPIHRRFSMSIGSARIPKENFYAGLR